MEELNLRGFRGYTIVLIALATSMFFLYTAFAGSFPAITQRGVLLILTLPLIFFLLPLKGKNEGNIGILGFILDLALIIMSVVSFVYIIVIQDDLMMRGGVPNNTDILMGLMAVIAILEATRRKVGMALPVIAAIFLAYGFLGPAMPGVLQHRGLDLHALISALYMGEEGIFGTPIAVTANFIVIFILFGSFLHASGAGQFFIDLANAMFGWMRGGPAKASVIGSCLMGTLSGSAVANVVTTGAFTIPLMKKTGYRKEVAGAVEAVASTGGQIMPPIMGAAAFIMAEFLNMPYINVVVAALIPALLYYAAVFFMVDLLAVKTGLKGLSRVELPSAKETLLKSGYLIIPVLILIYLLGFVKYSPQKAAFYTIVALLFIAAIKPHTRINLQRFLTAMIKGAIGVLEVAAVCACAGIVIGILMRTGLGLALTGILIDIAAGSLPVLMVLTMLTSIVLGMGLPTSACYIISAVLIAPAMVQMGVPAIAAHLFAFYYAILSTITPPVALAAYAGAGVAESHPMKTGIEAFKIGITGFIIPFMFVYGPPLLMIGSTSKIILACATALLGTYALAVSITGVLFTRLPIVLRIASFGSALCLIKPGIQTDIAGLSLIAIVFIGNFIQDKKERESALGNNNLQNQLS